MMVEGSWICQKLSDPLESGFRVAVPPSRGLRRTWLGIANGVAGRDALLCRGESSWIFKAKVRDSGSRSELLARSLAALGFA